MKHVAIIQIEFKLLSGMLDFEGGIIHRVYMPDNVWNPIMFCIVIEHPDLPEVPDNKILPTILPIFRKEQGANGVITKIERIDPPKKISG